MAADDSSPALESPARPAAPANFVHAHRNQEMGGGLDRRSLRTVVVFRILSLVPLPAFPIMFLEAAGLSTLVVAASEIGDKTQLLALILAARFRAPVPIILGILAATIFNHALAGIFGAALASWINPVYLKWALTISFLAMAAWMLVPDKADDDVKTEGRFGAFGTTLVLFFLAEMGDKTQLATVALAAHYQAAFSVVVGTTLGMLIADVPAVFVGEWIMKRVSLKTMRVFSCAIFVGLAALAFFAPTEGVEDLASIEKSAAPATLEAPLDGGGASEKAPQAPVGR